MLRVTTFRKPLCERCEPMRNIHPKRKFLLRLSILLCIFTQANAQDSNILYSVDRIERMLHNEPVRIDMPRGARFTGDKAMRVLLVGEDDFFIYSKLKAAPKGGEEINNRPRYEIAAYQLQKLFLDPADYVVPPTAGRGFPVDTLRELGIKAPSTFENTSSVFCNLQYWLNNVSQENVYDKKRFKSDTVYARHFGNFNILTYLIMHSDSNKGNALVSADPDNPRVFAVDNGVSFGDIYGLRGHRWRNLLVKRLPKRTIDRLQNIDLDDLEQVLGVVAQYRIQDGLLIATEPTENFNVSEGIRRSEDMIQLGLKENEIRKVYTRLTELLQKVDSKKMKVF